MSPWQRFTSRVGAAWRAVAAAYYRRRHRRTLRRPGARRVLIPFTRGQLDPAVLAAAVRIARIEEATLVPAYLILVPLEYPLDAPMSREVAIAIPLLEAIEHTALRAGVPVDARMESGRTPIHAIARLWDVEDFDRVVVPAPTEWTHGFRPDELLWMLTHAPSETVILRPDPRLAGSATLGLATGRAAA